MKDNNSSIFDAPTVHNDKQKGNKSRVITAVSVFLVLLVVLGGFFLSKKLIPEKKKNDTLDPKPILSIKEKDLESVYYHLKDADFTFKTESIEGYNNDGYVWKIVSLESEKQNFSVNNDFVSALCTLSGIKMVDENDKLYGLSAPFATVTLKTKDNNYTVIIGSDTGTDRYIKVEGKTNGVYRIDEETVKAIGIDKYGFATTDPYKIANFTSDVSAYKSSAGALITFDTLSFYSKEAGETLVFIPDKSNSENDSYLISSKNNAKARNVDLLFGLFTDTLYIDGVYSYFDSEEDISAFGLDSPDFEVKLTVAGEEKWFRFKKMDENSFAVLSDDRHLITKVSAENIPFSNLTSRDFYE